MTQDIFATRVQSLKASAIREIFKILEAKDVISFAAGAPSPDVFPGKELAAFANELLADNYSGALNIPLPKAILPCAMQSANALPAGQRSEKDNVIIVTGGQQGIDLAAKVLVEDGDGVVVESPSFIGGLNSFRSYNAKLFDLRLKKTHGFGTAGTNSQKQQNQAHLYDPNLPKSVRHYSKPGKPEKADCAR